MTSSGQKIGTFGGKPVGLIRNTQSFEPQRSREEVVELSQSNRRARWGTGRSGAALELGPWFTEKGSDDDAKAPSQIRGNWRNTRAGFGADSSHRTHITKSELERRKVLFPMFVGFSHSAMITGNGPTNLPSVGILLAGFLSQKRKWWGSPP